MNTWNNKGSRELIGHSKHFGTRFALDSVTVYPIIFPDNQGQVRLTQADFYFFIPSTLRLFNSCQKRESLVGPSVMRWGLVDDHLVAEDPAR